MTFKPTFILWLITSVYISGCDSATATVQQSSEDVGASSETMHGLNQLINQYDETIRHFHSEINSKFWLDPSLVFLVGESQLSALPELRDPSFSAIGDVSNCGFDDNGLDTYTDCELGYIYSSGNREILVILENYVSGNKKGGFREFTDAGERKLQIVVEEELTGFFWADFTENESGNDCRYTHLRYDEGSRASQIDCALAIQEALDFLQNL